MPSSTLTAEETQLIYCLEVLGLPLGAAARESGCPVQRVYLPHVIEARAALKRELASRTGLVKQDSINGIRDAIHDAKLLADPTAQIKGWQAINDMMGWNAPKKIEIEHDGVVELTRKNVRGLTDAELIKQTNAQDIIDADFYTVGK